MRKLKLYRNAGKMRCCITEKQKHRNIELVIAGHQNRTIISPYRESLACQSVPSKPRERQMWRTRARLASPQRNSNCKHNKTRVLPVRRGEAGEINTSANQNALLEHHFCFLEINKSRPECNKRRNNRNFFDRQIHPLDKSKIRASNTQLKKRARGAFEDVPVTAPSQLFQI